jgi:hypothetical protein
MHPPSVVYAMLIALALISAFLAGYQSAAEKGYSGCTSWIRRDRRIHHLRDIRHRVPPHRLGAHRRDRSSAGERARQHEMTLAS